jgi:hypothetical protein
MSEFAWYAGNAPGGTPNIRWALFNCDQETGLFTTRIWDSGSIAFSATGVKTITGLSVSIPAGLVYLAFNCDGTVNVVGGRVLGGLLGMAVPSGLSYVSPIFIRTISQTFGTMPTDLTGASYTNLGPTGQIPYGGFR